MIEVELKFQVPSEARAQLQTKLETLPSSKQLEQILNVDTYYDTANFDCLRQAVFIRTRNQKCLEVKYHEQVDPTHTHCTEQVFSLSSDPLQVKAVNNLCAQFFSEWQEAETIEEAFHANGLQEMVQLKNERHQYLYEQLTLCLDHVEELGDFFEIETSCQRESEIRKALASLEEFVAHLTLPALRQVKIGYVELWLRSHLPHVYQMGLYQAKDDVECAAYDESLQLI
ncbi:MAG TPA: CYTH domain-containing protein [Ktedonobacteraceae bacterium]|jgi:adenylate cyclase class IV